MQILGSLIAIVGLILVGVGGIWTLVVAFQESVLWGIGCILLPFVSLIFLVAHWNVAAKPFFVQLAGVALIFVGLLLAPPSLIDLHEDAAQVAVPHCRLA